MQREEKQLEAMLEAILMKLNDLKASIGAMIHKLETEYETINWPTFLDNFALVSSHLTGLSKLLSKDFTFIRNRTVLPLKLSPEPDDVLLQITEGRVPVFSHDICPDYLRTKPEPAAEQRMLQHEQKANSLLPETAMKQFTQYNKVISHVFDMVSKAREEWENETNTRTGPSQISSVTDTHALVAAIGMGKGLKSSMQVPTPGMMPPGAPGMMPRPPAAMGASVSPGVNPLGKAPAGIKTNIKSANQIHSFGR
ncbi:mediator of RNA polymerase II transcription subunit 8 [Condylostylus longicornis]|uniref:mediator of RNA polymerase II transcription subunit 8 n=1 Tax=Condylostylus longicornis TaxID=2530218 RepID=UPI00244E154E|nr:mediator of RNA polymerase II transcription subunit 8 [Condylostylus longicornis]